MYTAPVRKNSKPRVRPPFFFASPFRPLGPGRRKPGVALPWLERPWPVSLRKKTKRLQAHSLQGATVLRRETQHWFSCPLVSRSQPAWFPMVTLLFSSCGLGQVMEGLRASASPLST